MTSLMSPTAAVRFALIFCSFAVLLELWPSISSLIPEPPGKAQQQVVASAPPKAAKGKQHLPEGDRLEPPKDDKPGSQATWLLIALGGLVWLICIIAAFIVPQSHEGLLEESQQLKQDAERQLKEANQKLADADKKVEAAHARDKIAGDSIAEAQRTIEQSNSAKGAADERVKKANLKVKEAEGSRDRYEQAFASIKENKRIAAEARAAAEGEVAKLMGDAEKELTNQRAALENLRRDADAYSLATRQTADNVRDEATRLLDRAKQAEQNVRDREDTCTNRERAAAELERQLAGKAASLNVERIRVEQVAAKTTDDLEKATSERRDAQAARDAAERALQETLAAKNAVETLRNTFWPSWIIAGSVSPSIEQIEQFVAAGDINAAVLLSYLQVLQAVEKHPQFSKEFNYLWSTVRELGRCLASTLADNGSSPRESAERLTEWAKAINQVSRGRFTIAVPALGSPFNSAQMESKSSNIQTVSRVINWSVSNAKSIIASKAEVL